jgi:DNA polymerase-1
MKPNISKWKKWLEEPLHIGKYISFDMETTGLDIYKDQIHFVTWSLNGKEGHCIMRGDLNPGRIPSEVKEALEDKNVTTIIHSSQFDAPMFRLKTGIHIRNIWDTQIVQRVLLAGVFEIDEWKDVALAYVLKKYKIADLSKEVRDSFIGYFGPITKKQLNYGYDDIRYLKKLADLQLKRVIAEDLVNTVKLENLTCEVTAELRYNGIEFDEQYWMNLAEENGAEQQRRLKKLPKKVNNWNSPAQVKKFFKEEHDIEIASYEDIPDIKNKDLDNFKHFRDIYSSVTKYGFGFLKRKYRGRKDEVDTVDPDGRIRGSYDQVKDTGRYGISNPPLQTLPAKGLHRFAFTARKGYVLCVGDFTGQELGVIAAGSKEPVWIDAMLKGHDIHSVMADKIYSDWQTIGEKKCSFPFKCKCPRHQQLRRPAKDLNFGLAYGKGAESFAIESKMGLNEAYRIIRKYKASIPRVIKWLEYNGDFAVRHGWIRTLEPFKRLRYILGEDWKKRNRGKNTPVQGSGADMMKLAMCMIYDYIYENKLDVKLVLTVHDELLTEVIKAFAKQWCIIMKFFMEEASMFITKDKLVTTDPEIMERWKPKD